MRRNSLDEEKRRREREARACGREAPGVAADARALSDKLRSGDISRKRVVLAALLGDEAASLASGRKPDPALSAGFGTPPAGRRVLAPGLLTRGEAGGAIAEWADALGKISRRETGTNVGLWLAALASFEEFDLMERPGFDLREFGGTARQDTEMHDLVFEIKSIVASAREFTQRSLDSLPVGTHRDRGDRANEIWERVRSLHEGGELAPDMESLWDVVSDLYHLVSVLRTKANVGSLNLTRNLLDSAVAIVSLGDYPREDDVATVSERVLKRMIRYLLPGPLRRPGIIMNPRTAYCLSCGAVVGDTPECQACGLSVGVLSCVDNPDSGHLEEAAEWAADLFEKRTREIAAGRGRIDEILPETRVPWSEVRDRFGLTTMQDRTSWQPIWEAAIRRRGLLRVLRRHETAEQFVARRP